MRLRMLPAVRGWLSAQQCTCGAGTFKSARSQRSAQTLLATGEQTTSIIQRSKSASIWVVSSSPQGYCRSATVHPAECKRRRSRQTSSPDRSGSCASGHEARKLTQEIDVAQRSIIDRRRTTDRGNAGKACRDDSTRRGVPSCRRNRGQPGTRAVGER